MTAGCHVRPRTAIEGPLQNGTSFGTTERPERSDQKRVQLKEEVRVGKREEHEMLTVLERGRKDGVEIEKDLPESRFKRDCRSGADCTLRTQKSEAAINRLIFIRHRHDAPPPRAAKFLFCRFQNSSCRESGFAGQKVSFGHP
jgi:hypothetical protein